MIHSGKAYEVGRYFKTKLKTILKVRKKRIFETKIADKFRNL